MTPSAPDLSDRWVEIRASPLSVSDAHAFLVDERAGATSVFVGTTRRWTGDLETPALDYEAYLPMAHRQLDDVVAQAFAQWPLLRAVVLHRTGRVATTEASVVIGVASAHRGDAFDACRWLIDTLKAEVPIWKRDVIPHLSEPRDSIWL